MHINEDCIFSLKGKVIIITGATGFLGRKHAEVIASFGGNPVLIDLSETEVKIFADELNEKFSVDSRGYSVDITSEKQIEKNAKIIIDDYGKIDHLINNAAINPKVKLNFGKEFSRLENFPLDVWEKDIAVGLTGAFLCAKHYGYNIAQNKNGGSIINISSDLGLIAPDQRLYKKDDLPNASQPVKPVSYSVVKTGLIGLTRYLATYWPEHNVRCNAMCPGGIENNQPQSFIEEVSKRIPLGRLAKPNEYQSTLIWMLSESSCYLNGAIIQIDGGRSTI